MSEQTTQLTFDKSIKASAGAVYTAFTNAGMLRQWLCSSSQVSARENGRIYLYWQEGYYAAGHFTKLVENEAVSFTWQGKGEPFISHVRISLAEQDGQTAVSLTHSDIPSSEKWAKTREEFEAGWKSGLRNLKSVLETGLDRRVYDQPFLGTLIGTVLSEEQAAEQGLPIPGGIVIGGTLPGTGAEALGFENGDVLVNIGGSETATISALRDALRPFKAGEKVKVTYFRDGEKQSDMLVLSERPAPQVPSTPSEAADALRASFEQTANALDDLFDGVDEAAFNYRPGEEEWNVKDVLAHLLYTERYNQTLLVAQINNSVLDGFSSNPSAWIAAMSDVYESGEAMLTAWKNSVRETIAIVDNLPESYFNTKSYYLNTLNSLINFLPGHTQTHVEQIRTLLEEAREPVV